jgi:hypothetical protein
LRSFPKATRGFALNRILEHSDTVKRTSDLVRQ